MCSILLHVLCHILSKLKVQVGQRSTAAWGRRREPECEQSSLHKAAGPPLTAPRMRTHTDTRCPHSTAIWPAGKSEPPETRPNTWCLLTTRAFLLIVKRWIKIIQAHKVHGRTTVKQLLCSLLWSLAEILEDAGKQVKWSFQNRKHFCLYLLP